MKLPKIDISDADKQELVVCSYEEVINALDEKDGQPQHIVSSNWFKKWQAFAKGESKDSPGAINTDLKQYLVN